MAVTKKLWISLLLLVVIISSEVQPYRILGFFPLPARSHHHAIAPILHLLATRGHEVTYLTSIPPKLSHPKLKVKIMKNFWQEMLDAFNLTKLTGTSAPGISRKAALVFLQFSHNLYGNPVAQEIIQGNEKYDAVMMESYFAQEPISALIHKFGCVGIEVATFGDAAWVNELSGLPDNPSYQMDFKALSTDEMNFWERLYNFYITWSTILVSYYYLPQMEAVMDKYFNYTGWESRPPLTKLLSNRSIVIINQDVLIGYPYPLAPHAKQVGGLNIVPNKPLPQDIQKFMDEAPNGVIYFSLGSNLNTSEVSSTLFGESFFKNFEELPQRVLMKWETDTVPNYVKKSNNILTSKWFPQQDILAHKNILLFITHGGCQSLTETVYHGVPVIGIPFFGDQPKNMIQVNAAGFGVMLTRENITYESVRWALREILMNPRYKAEAKRRSEIMRSKRHTGLEDAAYWVEFGIKYPNFLTPRSAFLTFFQLHQIDIFLFLFGCVFLLIKTISVFIPKKKFKPKKKEHDKEKKQ